MREILILSGKGGTGKTSFTAAFAHQAQKDHRLVIADLDVDAPDLHLLLNPSQGETISFYAGNEAVVQPESCSGCGTCRDMCRFSAVMEKETVYSIDPIRCEGCGVCVHFCPENAISFDERLCGNRWVSDTRFGKLVHARLFPGEENSGKLVAELRKNAGTLAEEIGAEIIISDGPPGIGCPVISALTGIDLVVLITEPTPTGYHDLERIHELCGHFNIPSAIIINKEDLNPDYAKKIREVFQEKNTPVLAGIPHDPDFVAAAVNRMAITEFTESKTAEEMEIAWRAVVEHDRKLAAASAA